MFMHAKKILCALVPTAVSARYRARMALHTGRYADAAECYAIASRRQGDDLTQPYFSDSIHGPVLLRCAQAAKRIATQEGQQLRKRAMAIADGEPLRASFTGGIPAPCGFLSESEKMLFAISTNFDSEMVFAVGAQGLYSRRTVLYDCGIGGLFHVRRLGALAENGDVEALERLASNAIGTSAFSRRADRELGRLSDLGMKRASDLMSHVCAENHSIFLNQQRMREERLQDEILFYRYLP